jgi:hypothetical protein
MLVCKHCGESCCIGKGYYGSYSTSNDELHKQLNIFYKEHEHGCCSDEADCSDNARNHFAILEEGEDLDVLTADVVPKSEVADLQDALKCEKETNKHLSDEYIALQKALDAYEETSGLKHAKAEVAREIFEEIEKTFIDSAALPNCARFVDIDKIAELKKKYTEEPE